MQSTVADSVKVAGHRILRNLRLPAGGGIAGPLILRVLSKPTCESVVGRRAMTGGPASGQQDPVAEQYLQGCAAEVLRRRHRLLLHQRGGDQLETPASWVTAWAAGE